MAITDWFEDVDNGGLSRAESEGSAGGEAQDSSRRSRLEMGEERRHTSATHVRSEGEDTIGGDDRRLDKVLVHCAQCRGAVGNHDKLGVRIFPQTFSHVREDPPYLEAAWLRLWQDARGSKIFATAQ